MIPIGWEGDSFQSRTGSTGHLAHTLENQSNILVTVSIPNGLHRPFSPNKRRFERHLRDRVSIPNGLHRPFSQGILLLSTLDLREFQSRTGSTGHLAVINYRESYDLYCVSIPNGLHRPFSPRQAMPTSHSYRGFNPERAPQAI